MTDAPDPNPLNLDGKKAVRVEIDDDPDRHAADDPVHLRWAADKLQTQLDNLGDVVRANERKALIPLAGFWAVVAVGLSGKVPGLVDAQLGWRLFALFLGGASLLCAVVAIFPRRQTDMNPDNYWDEDWKGDTFSSSAARATISKLIECIRARKSVAADKGFWAAGAQLFGLFGILLVVVLMWLGGTSV